jgi:DNA repair protein RecN (Recombination protein N)
LPQVAAFADNHLRVLKTCGEDFTSTDVTQLNDEQRMQEIARMLSGLQESETGTAHAKELLEVARSFKE